MSCTTDAAAPSRSYEPGLAKDIDANPRKIKSFNSSEVFIGGERTEHGGETWIEMKARVPVKELFE